MDTCGNNTPLLVLDISSMADAAGGKPDVLTATCPIEMDTIKKQTVVSEFFFIKLSL
jgi:hypothetical protein